MSRRRLILILIFAIATVPLILISCEGPVPKKENGEQPPEKDYKVGPSYQEMPTFFGPDDGLPLDVKDVAAFKGKVYFATAKGTFLFGEKGFTKIDERVSSKLFSGSYLWIGLDEGAVLAYDGDNFDTYQISGEPKVLSLWEDSNERLWVGTEGGLFVIENGKLNDTSAGSGRFVGVCEAFGSVFAATPSKIVKLTGEDKWEEQSLKLLGQVSTLFGTSEKLFIGTRSTDGITDGGLNILNKSGKLEAITGKHGYLPYHDITSVYVDSDSEIGEVIWVGTSIGVCRKALYNERWNYYASFRFLPSDNIRAVFPETEKRIWVATDNGAGLLEFKKYTLEQKANIMQEATMERHDRDPGLVCDCILTEPGNLDSHEHTDCDNDGLWTAMYMGGLTFKYAVTKDPETKDLVERHIAAIILLENVTVEELDPYGVFDELPAYIPGLIARSVLPLGSRSNDPNCYPYCQWRPNTAMGYDWKSDVSSDEATGHFFIYGVYWDLMCGPDKSKWVGDHCKEAHETVEKIMDHIIDHDFFFIDWTGRHTSWGVWNPRLLTDPLNSDEPSVRDYVGLVYCNSLEILSFIRTAQHIMKDAAQCYPDQADKYEKKYKKYEDALQYLIQAWNYDHYAEYADVWVLGITNHSTDELIFLSYYNLLRYETDPLLLEKWVNSIHRAWLYNRLEQCPLWNFIYGAVTPNIADFGWDDATFNLVNQPIDMIEWTVKNSQRADIKWFPFMDRSNERQMDLTEYPLPPDERPVDRWNTNPYTPDGGCAGCAELDAGHFVLPYWMGRYHGFIVEDKKQEVRWP